MKREILAGKDFCTYVKTPLVADDVHAYNIVWETGENLEGAGLLINAKRSDGVTVTDFGIINEDGRGEYVLAGNMYSVTGSLEVRLSVVSQGTTLTEKMLIFEVIEGNGNESIEAEDNVPLLTNVLSQSIEAIASADRASLKAEQAVTSSNEATLKAEEAITNSGEATLKAEEAITNSGEATLKAEQAIIKAEEATQTAQEAIERIPNVPTKLSEYENDCGYISKITEELIPDGIITPEKINFYDDVELSKIGYLKTVTLKANEPTVIDDRIPKIPLKRIEVAGNSVQYDNIINCRDAFGWATNHNCSAYGFVNGKILINGTMEAGEEINLPMTEITFYEGNTYRLELTATDEAKLNMLSVYVENFTEGKQSRDITSSAIKLIQGAEECKYENLFINCRIYEEERSGKNIYPIYSLKNPSIFTDTKNYIGFEDFDSSDDCTISIENDVMVLEGKNYVNGPLHLFTTPEYAVKPEEMWTISFVSTYTEGCGMVNIPRLEVIYEDGTKTYWSNENPTAAMENKPVREVIFVVSEGEDVRLEIKNLMFEKGETASEYCETAYWGYDIPIKETKLCKIGKLSDKLIIEENEVYLLEHINKDKIDETKDINEQVGAAAMLPQKKSHPKLTYNPFEFFMEREGVFICFDRDGLLEEIKITYWAKHKDLDSKIKTVVGNVLGGAS